MNIVFLDAGTLFDVPNLNRLSTYGKLTTYHQTAPEDTITRLQHAEIAISNKVVIDSNVIDQCPELKLICIAATGTNNVDKAYAASKNIRVMNVTDYSTHSVAQIVFTMILTLIQQPRYYNDYVKFGKYAQNEFFTHIGKPFWQLAGKRIGIIGLGNIGLQVALIASAFGMEIIYCSISGNHYNKTYLALPLYELLSTSDIVTIHTPLTERTKNLISYDQLRLMKQHAILINTSRGGIVVEKDITRALDEGIIAGAGLDVYEKEPISINHPLYKMQHPEKLLTFPHIAWASIEARTLLIDKVCQNIEEYCQGL